MMTGHERRRTVGQDKEEGWDNMKEGQDNASHVDAQRPVAMFADTRNDDEDDACHVNAQPHRWWERQ